MNKTKGFTLIELLVVVAIIGILATVVLASLGQARTRARDAAIQAAISQARADLEINLLDYNTYEYVDSSGTIDDGSCEDVVATFTTSIDSNGGSAITCNATDNSYAYFAELNDGATIFCADSTGFAGEASPSSGDTACN